MEKRIDNALQGLQSNGFVKPCGQHCCRQCNPRNFMTPVGDASTNSSSGRASASSSPTTLSSSSSSGRLQQQQQKQNQQKPSKFTRIFPYPSECVAARAARAAGCKPRAVNHHVLAARLQKHPNAFHYFAAFKPRGVTSMRKLGGGGFGRVCRDYLQQQSASASGAKPGVGCAFGASCRFLHPGTFQVQSVYHTLPLNWPPVPHVGRLDVATEGLILFTDDGQLQSALLEKDGGGRGGQRATAAEGGGGVKRSGDGDGGVTRPLPSEVKKVYLVQVSREEEMARRDGIATAGKSDDADSSEPDSDNSSRPHPAESDGAPVVTSAMLESLCQPLVYEEDGIVTRPAQARLIDSSEMRKLFRAFPGRHRAPCEAAAHSLSKVLASDRTAWVRVQIEEGRNRQVRRLCARAGLAVHRLIRWGFGPITLRDLQGASAAPLSSGQVAECQKCCGLGSTTAVLPINRPIFRVGGSTGKTNRRASTAKRKNEGASAVAAEGAADSTQPHGKKKKKQKKNSSSSSSSSNSNSNSKKKRRGRRGGAGRNKQKNASAETHAK